MTAPPSGGYYLPDMLDQRKHPRVSTSFEIQLGPLLSATVHDVSRNGLRCTTVKPLAPMTLQGLVLELPTGKDEYLELACRGVVVRCDATSDENGPRFEAAILFQDLSPAQIELLDSWISHRLSRPAD